MPPDNTNQYLVIEEKHINALLIGIPNVLKNVLTSTLLKNGCNILDEKDLSKHLPVEYIFIANKPQLVSKYIYLAYKKKSKFIYISTEENQKKEIKVAQIINQINADVRVFLFSIPLPKTENEASKSIEKIFNNLTLNKNKIHPNTSNKNLKGVSSKNNKKFKINFFAFSLFLSVILVTLFFTSIFFPLYITVKTLNQASTDFFNGNFSEVKKKADNSEKLLKIGNNNLQYILPLIKKIRYEDGKSLEDSYKILLQLSGTLSDAAYTSSLANNIANTIMTSKINLHESEITDLSTEIKNLDSKIQLLLVQIKELEKNNSPLFKQLKINDQLRKGEETLSGVIDLLRLADRFSIILPDILGYQKPKTFLILFQNNTELRPTGGFIGSFGWITFSEGKLIDFKTEDVYTADGQLKGHVPPPDPIKKYLQQENWYLRDSNFDPDFAVSASQAEWFLKKEMNLNFDGVIAVDLNSVQEILRAIDGVYLTDYKEEITAENLFLKTQSATELNFFPGSTQKRDFLGSLARSLFIKLTSNKVQMNKLLMSLKTSLDQKNILLYFHNEEAQFIVEKANWAGRIGTVNCQNTECNTDYLMINEANLGINKGNFLIDRSVDLTLLKNGDNLEHNLIINYKNDSPNDVFPAGQYFSYTRILLPQDINLTGVWIDQEPVSKEDLTVGLYQDKKLLGFPFKIEAKTSRNVKIQYNKLINYKNKMEFLIQKQPGIKSFPLNLRLNDKITNSNIFEKTIIIEGDEIETINLSSNL